jgi:hypothetical protein
MMDRIRRSSALESSPTGDQTVMLTTVWWKQKCARDWQGVNKQCTDFIWRCSFSSNETGWSVRSNDVLRSNICLQLWET